MNAQYGEAEDEGSMSVINAPIPLTARMEVSGAAEVRLNGVYNVQFATRDCVEFHKDGDIKCQVSWNEYNEEWRMLIRDYKLGSTLYRHKYHPNVRIDECHGVPKDSWQVWFGKAPAPSIRYVPIDEVISPQVQTDSDTSGVNVSDNSEETSNTVHEQQ